MATIDGVVDNGLSQSLRRSTRRGDAVLGFCRFYGARIVAMKRWLIVFAVLIADGAIGAVGIIASHSMAIVAADLHYRHSGHRINVAGVPASCRSPSAGQQFPRACLMPAHVRNAKRVSNVVG